MTLDKLLPILLVNGLAWVIAGVVVLLGVVTPGRVLAGIVVTQVLLAFWLAQVHSSSE